MLGIEANVEESGTLIWTSPGGLRCIVVPYFGRVQLRLLRGVHVVRTEVFADEAPALVASRKWRLLWARRPRAKTR